MDGRFGQTINPAIGGKSAVKPIVVCPERRQAPVTRRDQPRRSQVRFFTIDTVIINFKP